MVKKEKGYMINRLKRAANRCNKNWWGLIFWSFLPVIVLVILWYFC